ncbi:hypothetical protein [Marinicella meishanensis]|uniref:hypothetical protein n=1 Tax=Marinicella meishanensis TaxID=2873263 RepID=UPI001CBE9EEB|nr:hypothetical protein [Marinicella sp. NBU2979]
MKQVMLMITLLVFPILAQADEMVSPVLMLIHWVYGTTYVMTCLVVACAVGLLIQHHKNSPQKES